MADYIELNSSNFDSTIAKGISFVDFWAPWCGPCKMLAPIVEELATEYKDKANICKVNTDENQDISVKYGIRSIPTVIIFRDGEKVDQLVGVSSKQSLKDKLDSFLG